MLSLKILHSFYFNNQSIKKEILSVIINLEKEFEVCARQRICEVRFFTDFDNL